MPYVEDPEPPEPVPYDDDPLLGEPVSEPVEPLEPEPIDPVEPVEPLEPDCAVAGTPTKSSPAAPRPATKPHPIFM